MLRPLIRAAHSAVPTKPNRVKTSRPQFRTAALRTFSATRYVTDDQHTTQHADSTVTRDLTDDQRPTPLAGAVTDQMNSFKWPHKTIERDLVNEENSPIITRALIGSCGIDIELMECFRGELEFLLFNSEIKGVGTDGGKDVAGHDAAHKELTKAFRPTVELRVLRHENGSVDVAYLFVKAHASQEPDIKGFMDTDLACGDLVMVPYERKYYPVDEQAKIARRSAFSKLWERVVGMFR